MTIDEAITYIKETCYGEWCEDDWREAMDMAISALQTEKKSPNGDVIPRKSVEYICKKETISTNPDDHKHSDKFIQFMDDEEISDFGRWRWANGFNTALVAVRCGLDKVPSVQPEPLTDKEKRIFLAAMGREEDVCKQVDAECRDCREPYEDSLVRICHEIIRKVKGALWT